MRVTPPVDAPRARRALRMMCAVALLAGLAQRSAANSTVTFTFVRATGTILENTPGGPVSVPFVKMLTDTFSFWRPFPPDTIPPHVLLEFAWHAVPIPPATKITGYEYRFGGNTVSVGPDVESASIDLRPPGVSAPVGYQTMLEVFAHDDTPDGGGEVSRWFQMNFAPDTWFSGPDPGSIAVVPGSGGQRYLDVPNWNAVPAVVKSLLSCDSLTQLPSQRPEHRTFFEIYGNRIYLRAEGDTVNRGSWLVFHHGGFDVDSPYAVHVAPGAPIPGSATCSPFGPLSVITPAGVIGSPVGFRLRVPVAVGPGDSLVSQPSETTTYPWFDPASVFNQPVVGGYWSITSSGRAYATARAEDGDGTVDRRIDYAGGEKAIVDHVEQGIATPEELALRHLILTFYVNRAPFLEFGHSGFFPRPPQYNAGQVAGSPDRTLRLRWFANDPDPRDPSTPYTLVGGPTGPPVLRYSTTVTGFAADLQPTSYHAPPVVGGTSLAQDIDLASLAPEIVSDEVTVHLQLCDCATCESLPGSGRCVDLDIPVQLGAPLGVPSARPPALALYGFQPNPGVGEVAIAYVLPDDRPATLELFDTSGRRVWNAHPVPGAGPHRVRIDRALAPGVYVIRLSHGGSVRFARAAIVR